MRQLSHGDESIRRSSVNRGIVCAEVRNGTKPAALEARLELGSRPTSHHEAIVARLFSSVVDQGVRFRQKKLPALRIEFRGARERELASVRENALSKNGLALLTVLVASHSRTSRIRTPGRRSAPANAANTDWRASSFTKSLRTPRQRMPYTAPQAERGGPRREMRRNCRDRGRTAWRSRSIRTTGRRLQRHNLGARARRHIGLFHSRHQEALRPEGRPAH